MPVVANNEVYKNDFQNFGNQEEYVVQYLGNPAVKPTSISQVKGVIDRGYCPETYTATADWTTYDVIGGIFPKVNENGDLVYGIKRGCIYDTVMKNWDEKRAEVSVWVRSPYRKLEEENGFYTGVWLVIDELNRADIDKAFGEVFTAIEYKKLLVPSIMGGAGKREVLIPEDYRVIGTLNTFDRHHLHELSEAFKRRFAFVRIEPPDDTVQNVEKYIIIKKAKSFLSNLGVEESANLDKWIQLDSRSKSITKDSDSDFVLAVEVLFNLVRFIRKFHALGTAQILAVMKYMLSGSLRGQSFLDSLDEGVATNIARELERLHPSFIRAIKWWSEGTLLDKMKEMTKKDRSEQQEEVLQSFLKYLEGIDGLGKLTLGPGDKWEEIEEEIKERWSKMEHANLSETASELDAIIRELGY